jgi:hypothetical protein
VFDEVNVDKDPAPADLRAGNLSGASLLLQRHRMDVQEGSGSLQIERVHGAIPSGECFDESLASQVHQMRSCTFGLFVTVSSYVQLPGQALVDQRVMLKALYIKSDHGSPVGHRGRLIQEIDHGRIPPSFPK